MTMSIFDTLILGFSTVLSLHNLLFCFIGVFIGTLIGVLPGIGPVATISLLLPASFSMEALPSIIMLCGVYYGAMYGGSRTSILLNIPGEAASIVTCLDGYPMARKGRAGPALGMAAFAGFIALTFGIVMLMLLAPVLARGALKFGPPENFALMFFGLTMVTYMAQGSIIKALIMAAAGITAASVGQDPMSGSTRFTMGSMTLMDGLGLVPAAMGMFGIGEVLIDLEADVKQEKFSGKIKGLFPTVQDWTDSKWAIVRGTLIGFFVGVLPGGGTVVPTFMAYATEKRLSKHPEKFGTGIIEGVAAPEAANHAATGGSLVTLLSLGIPANIVMAVLLGGFVIHGIQPGPLLIVREPQLFWGIICSMYIGNIMLVLLNVPLVGVWIKLLNVPFNVLFPLILIFCVLGVYTINNNPYEIVVMIGFGVFGYLARKFDYEGAPFLLGMVLGPMFETAYRQSLGYGGQMSVFFRRPISAILIGASLLLLMTSILPKIRHRRKELVEKLE
jgi:putative tricarboxylic transport membrane protein